MEDTPALPPRPAALRIGVVVSQLGYGGAERQTVLLLEALASTPWRPDLVVCLSADLEPYGERLRALDYPLDVVTRGGNVEVSRAWRLGRVLARHGVTLVHAVHLLGSGYCWLASLRPGGPRVLPTMRGTVVRPGALRTFVYRRMFRHCPLALANSWSGARWLTTEFRADPARIRVVPNGIDFAGLRTAAEGSTREMLGLPCDVPLVVYVGKPSPVKDLPTFLEAFRQLRVRRPGVRGVLAGSGLTEEWVRTTAPDLAGVLLGLGPRADLPRVVAACDLLGLSSLSEGCPNVVLEALGLGVPVASTEVGDVARILEITGGGRTAPVGDAAALAGAMDDVLAGLPDYRARIAAGRDALERHFALPRMVEATVGVWRELAAC